MRIRLLGEDLLLTKSIFSMRGEFVIINIY